MKTWLKKGILFSLALSIILGNVPFRAMLVCVHGGGSHGEKAVHLHYDQLPGLPCHESSAGLTPVTHEEERRHFSLAAETLTHVQTPFKRFMDLLSPAQDQTRPVMVNLPGGGCTGLPLHDPSFLLLDTAFSKTTVLII